MFLCLSSSTTSMFVRLTYDISRYLLVIIAGSVIVITGASSGMGREMTMRYAERGAKIVIGSRSIDRLNEV